MQTTSPVTDLSAVTGAIFTAWVRRGADAFSEDPDPGEDFEIQYLDSIGNWVTLRQFEGAGTKGEIINVSETLPFGALHSGFRIRVQQSAGSNLPFDYWHIDDVAITETGAPPPPPGGGDLGVNRCEDFENGFGNWTTTIATRSGIGSQTSNSISRSLYTRHGAVTTTSISFNSAGLNQITVWVRRGSDTFSENPEGNENLRFQYLNASNNWVTLETFRGRGTQGQIFNRT